MRAKVVSRGSFACIPIIGGVQEMGHRVNRTDRIRIGGNRYSAGDREEIVQ